MSCQLGLISSPINGYTYKTASFPYGIQLLVDSNTPLSEYQVQVSTDILFINLEGYITQSINNETFINVPSQGTYFIRISCDGNTWSGYNYFTVEELPQSEISFLTNANIDLNSENTGFNIIIPQLLYGPPINTSPLSPIYYVNTLEIEISTDNTFTNNVYRFFQYGKRYGDLYKNSCILPEIDLSLIYYFRIRYYDVTINQWSAWFTSTNYWSPNGI